MQKFEYTHASKFLYRYSILPLSLILLTYFVIQTLEVRRYPLMIIPALITGGMLYLANKYYFRTYKTLPFTIAADKEKLSASNFMLGNKTVEIKYSDIDAVTGGVFAYNRKGLITIHDGKNKVSIAIHPAIINVDALIKIIADNVNAELREDMITRLRRWEEK